MPAVALPQLRPDLKKIVKYPISPANPPTFKDVAAAINLSNEVMAARQRSEATDEELVKAYRYQMSLVLSDEGGEPAWFAHAMTRVLAPIREDLAELNEKAAKLTTDLNHLTDKVTRMDNRFKTVQSSNAQIRRMAAITWNRSRGSGREARLEVVPFESGDDPTTHGLPLLSTVKAVQNLAAASRDLYFEGYYPDIPLPPVPDRIPRILAALGVMI